MKMTEYNGWYFTAPWEPIVMRRGDPLGFRASADYFADLLAPGLSNSTSDARWISIISWCLKWSHVAWHKAGGGALSRRDDQRARYAWLRPLELLWIARTLESEQGTGQLRGRRSIERWRKSDFKSSNFAMTPDQFRRYRQAGTYGAYRVVFRSLPGLTTGDGWTPDKIALKLAELVNKSLPVQLNQEDFERATKWNTWVGRETEYWMSRGWSQWREKPQIGFHPTPNDEINEKLPEMERKLLEQALFSEGSTRHSTAIVLAKAEKEWTHADLCEALSSSSLLSKQINSKSLAALPTFTRFADAAMDAMREVWWKINNDDTTQTPTIKKIVSFDEVRDSLDQLRAMSNLWLHAPGRDAVPHEQVATQLAEAMQNASTVIDQLRALTKHHQEYGGGRRWFREQAGKLEPLVPDTGIVATDYRFRLYPLTRLAAQCGVADMSNALQAISRQGSDQEFDEDGEDVL